MKQTSSHVSGIMDHVFIGGGLEWNVFVRVVPNQNGSTISWIFIRPNGLNDNQFEDQLKSAIFALLTFHFRRLQNGPFHVFSEKLPYVPSYLKLRLLSFATSVFVEACSIRLDSKASGISILQNATENTGVEKKSYRRLLNLV